MTKKKKQSNPIMSPEWIKSLLDVCVVPTVALDEFGTMSDEQAEAIGALLEGASGEQSTAAPPHPVDPGLLEGLTNCLEDAKRSLEGALANVSEIREDRERWLIATDMPINEEVQNMYGGGGMSPDAIKLDDAYYTIKRLLDDDLVTSREVCEFVDAVERLIER